MVAIDELRNAGDGRWRPAAKDDCLGVVNPDAAERWTDDWPRHFRPNAGDPPE